MMSQTYLASQTTNEKFIFSEGKGCWMVFLLLSTSLPGDCKWEAGCI